MKKLLLILAIIIIASFTSCGKIGNSSNPEENNPTAQVDTGSGGEENGANTVTDNGRKSKEDADSKDSVGKNRDDSKSNTANNIDQATFENAINNANNRINEIGDSVSINSRAISNCYFCQYGILAYVVYAFAIIILFLILRLIWKIITAKSPEAKSAEKEEKRTLNKKIKDLEWQLTELKNSYETLKLKIQNINNEVTSIGNNIVYEGSKLNDNINNSTKPANTNYSLRKNNIQPTSNKQMEFYLRFPGIDGTFENKHVPRSDGYYRFILHKHNPETAEFTFSPENATAMRKALNNRPDYIEKACDPINTFETSMSSCRPVDNEYGEAKLVNGKWVIMTKQKVRYE